MHRLPGYGSHVRFDIDGDVSGSSVGGVVFEVSPEKAKELAHLLGEHGVRVF